jgi:hypothetical protein
MAAILATLLAHHGAEWAAQGVTPTERLHILRLLRTHPGSAAGRTTPRGAGSGSAEADLAVAVLAIADRIVDEEVLREAEWLARAPGSTPGADRVRSAADDCAVRLRAALLAAADQQELLRAREAGGPGLLRPTSEPGHQHWLLRGSDGRRGGGL